MKVVFAAAAESDLIEIGEHIQQDNPERAVTFVLELTDHCYTLADMPRRYPLVRVTRVSASGVVRMATI